MQAITVQQTSPLVKLPPPLLSPAAQVHSLIPARQRTPCSASYSTSDGLSNALTVSYSNNVNAGTATAIASYAGDTNHAGSSDSEDFVIGQASSTTTVTCGNGPFTFNGSAQEPCTASYTTSDGQSGSLTVIYGNNINAGTASASASYAGDSNHAGSSDSKTFTIDQAATTTTVTCQAGPFIYDGTAQTPCSASVTGPGNLNQPLTVNYSNNVTAGPATASASYAGDNNHKPSSDSKTFTIDKATSETVLTCEAGPFTYTGSAIEPCSAKVTGAGGLDQSVDVTYLSNVNAGSATANASFAGDDNHYGSSNSATFTIDKAPAVVAVSCPSNVTYTGLSLAPCSAAVTGAGGLNQSLTVSYTDNTNAGTATASASFAGDDNHYGSSNSATFTIDKAPSVVAVSCPSNVTYTGLSLTPCSATVTGAGGLNQSLTVSYSDNTNAGVATAGASFAGDDNHLNSSNSTIFTIDKAVSLTTVSCPASFYFTGSPITPCSATVTGAGGLSQSLTVIYSNNIAVGTATANASYAGDANHEPSTESATFQILAWTLKGFYQPVDMNGVLNTVKGGSTVPLKFEVFAGSTELTNTSIVSSLVKGVTCNATQEDTIEVVATGGTSLRYDTTGGQFIFNWQTPKLPGHCYIVTLTTHDGSTLSALFKLK